jgi:hypothetical protein
LLLPFENSEKGSNKSKRVLKSFFAVYLIRGMSEVCHNNYRLAPHILINLLHFAPKPERKMGLLAIFCDKKDAATQQVIVRLAVSKK